MSAPRFRTALPATLLRALALAAVVGLAAAAALAWRDARDQGWWDDEIPRLVVERLWFWFDRVGGALAGVALLAALLRAWRRPAHRPVAAAAVVVALVLAARLADLAGVPAPPRRPNVLLISSDTLRADRLGAYGYGPPTSPRVDAGLAAEGVTFDEVWSQSPKTTPSHMTMLTSLYPCVHGILMWEDASARPRLNPRVPTLAEVLRAAGYDTAAFTAGGPMDRSRGFDEGFGVYKQGRQVERAAEWLTGRRAGRPFFLFVHVYDAHDPYLPPPALEAQFAPADYTGPMRQVVAAIRDDPRGWESAHRRYWADVRPDDAATARFLSGLYDGAIRQSDDTTVTRLLDLLRRTGTDRDTLVIFTSDHGEAFAEHGRFLHDDLHAETLRVPLVLRLPGVLPAGRRVTAPARTLDVMPTILDLLGIAAPADVQGRSLAGLARGDAPAGDAPPRISEHGNPDTGWRTESVRADGFALLRDGGAAQLYDAARDPGERHDVADASPGRVAALDGVLAGWRAECARLAPRYGPTGPGVAPSADAMQKLRALGYVQ